MNTSALSCRLLPYEVADGPHNMAADEVLLETAAAGRASLRFYGWSPPTLSLGYFQPVRLRQEEEHLADLAYVRRPSGGMTLVHDHEITYALALPAGFCPSPKRERGVGPNPSFTLRARTESWLQRMHWIIAAALAEQGVLVELHQGPSGPPGSGPLCFHHVTPGDLLLGRAKVVGSAQRKQREALLQHGGILLAGSRYTPSLPGIRELRGQNLDVGETCWAIQKNLGTETGWDLVAEDWTNQERQRIEEVALNKYTKASWNDRR